MANIHKEQHSIRKCRWFPQFVFTLLTCVRPIKVGILNHFLRVADDRLPTVLIKKKMKKIILKVPFLPLKIAFFWVSGNDKKGMPR